MKKLLLTMTFAFCACHVVWADPACPTSATSLATYVATTFTCGDLTFSGLTYSPSGSNQIPVGDVSVTFVTEGGESGLQFNAPFGAAPGGSSDADIVFTATCNDNCAITDLDLTVGGLNISPGGLALVSETSPVLSGLPSGGLAAGSTGSTTILSDSDTFSPVTSLTVTKDILVFGGTSGLGSQVSNVQNLFSTNMTTVPEPSTIFLCAGLLGLLPLARRKFGF